MRISKIHIKNFRNLRDVILNDLGNTVVLIGKNSSGKSNLLEALYLVFCRFNFVEPSPLGAIAGIDQNLWHNYETKNPIEITIELEFDPNECEEIFPRDVLDILKNRVPDHYSKVTFCRVLDFEAGWRTAYVKWADTMIVRDNKLVTPNDFCNSFSMRTSIEAKATSPILESEGAKMIGKLTAGLQERIKGKFRMARVSRDSVERSSEVVEGTRIVNADTLQMLRSLGQSHERGDIQKWTDIEEIVETFSSMRLDARGNEIFAKRDNLYFAVHLIGGGDQEILNLENFLLHSETAVVAIEELEMHLHPQLIKRVLKLVKESARNSQVFLSTHSPTIIQNTDARCLWIAKTEGKETRFLNVHTEKLENVLAESEISIPDLLFAERILLVNGVLEKVMLPILARNLGVDPDAFLIVPLTLRLEETGGKLSLLKRRLPRQHRALSLRAWNDFSRGINTPLFLLLYEDVRSEVEMLIGKGSLKLRNCAILTTSLIDYTPLETVMNVLNENYGLHLNIKDITAGSPRIHDIEAMLTRHGKLHPEWMTAIAQKAALKMSKETIPNEVKMLFEEMMKC